MKQIKIANHESIILHIKFMIDIDRKFLSKHPLKNNIEIFLPIFLQNLYKDFKDIKRAFQFFQIIKIIFNWNIIFSHLSFTFYHLKSPDFFRNSRLCYSLNDHQIKE